MKRWPFLLLPLLAACGGPRESGSESVAKVAAAPVAADESFVAAADGVRLYYEVVGAGQAVVLVPMRHLLRAPLAASEIARDHTLVFYDPRDRGRSGAVDDLSSLTMHQDVEDLESVRSHVGAATVALVGVGDFGKVVAMYAAKYPQRVERIVQLAPTAPDAGRIFPPHLSASDRIQVLTEGLEEIYRMRAEGLQESDPQAYCEAEWEIFSRTLIADPANAGAVGSPCALEREWPVNLQRHFESAAPANRSISLSAAELAEISLPILTIHGTGDRNVPYGAGRQWAFELGNARLLTIEGAAHFSWIEHHALVVGAIETFLDGEWPHAAEIVERVDPQVDPDEEV